MIGQERIYILVLIKPGLMSEFRTIMHFHNEKEGYLYDVKNTGAEI